VPCDHSSSVALRLTLDGVHRENLWQACHTSDELTGSRHHSACGVPGCTGTNGAEAAERAAERSGARTLIAARVSTVALVASLGLLSGSSAVAAPTTVGASPARGDRLSAAAGAAVIETITVEARAANTSTLTRVPVGQR
jgi:hypothetical protein